MAQIVDSYSESNYSSSSFIIYSSQPAYGQVFTGDGGILQNAKFYSRKFGSPTGTGYIKIYAMTGTFGTDGRPTGAVLATSSFDVSTIGTSFSLETFIFTGANKITLTNATKYCVVLEYTGGDINNYIGMGYDGTSPTHDGNLCSYSGGVWSGADYGDVCFYVYKDESSPSVTPSASISSTPSATLSLTISSSPSASPSITPSASISATSSASPSITPSASVSDTPSASNSPSPSPAPPETMKLVVAKDGENALTEYDPTKFKFHSDYGTLKYYKTGTLNFTIDGDLDGNLETGGKATTSHDLGYYPYVEVYLLNPIGKYEYCPTYNGGAGTSWQTWFIVGVGVAKY